MKFYAIILFFLVLLPCSSYGQACGVYYFKLTGYIESSELQVTKLKLPWTPYLHGISDEKDIDAFIQIDLTKNKINEKLPSHLTSAGLKANHVIQLYKTKRNSIPITIEAIGKDQKTHQFEFILTWEQVKLNPTNQDDCIFEMDLGNLKIE